FMTGRGREAVDAVRVEHMAAVAADLPVLREAAVVVEHPAEVDLGLGERVLRVGEFFGEHTKELASLLAQRRGIELGLLGRVERLAADVNDGAMLSMLALAAARGDDQRSEHSEDAGRSCNTELRTSGAKHRAMVSARLSAAT